jgi:hypothetical protein
MQSFKSLELAIKDSATPLHHIFAQSLDVF